MKKIILLLLFSCCFTLLYAQEIQSWCTKKMRNTAKPKVDSVLLQKKLRALSITATTPYLIKIFVVIFSTDDGTGETCSNDDVKRQITNMRDYYAPHNICFTLGDIRRVNNTTLYNMNADDEEDLLIPYLKEGFITVFVHNSVFSADHPGLAGIAYGIPNNYLSVEGPVLAGDTKRLLAHEMGHCFGLYHTFEDAFGEENVARSGGCKDCDSDGDYLCDTQADRDAGDNYFDNNCKYTGLLRDACGSPLLMATDNLMSYHSADCSTRFTAGQGNRCRDHIVSESILSDAIAPDNLTIYFSFIYTSDYRIYLARNTVTFNTANYVATGTAKVNASANAIVVKAGTQFVPTSNSGYAVLRVNPFCQ